MLFETEGLHIQMNLIIVLISQPTMSFNSNVNFVWGNLEELGNEFIFCLQLTQLVGYKAWQ